MTCAAICRVRLYRTSPRACSLSIHGGPLRANGTNLAPFLVNHLFHLDLPIRTGEPRLLHSAQPPCFPSPPGERARVRGEPILAVSLVFPPNPTRVGRLHLSTGEPDYLMSSTFRYNVRAWAPEIEHQGNTVTIRQGGDEGRWGIPSGNVQNRWELEVSPLVPGLAAHAWT